MCYKTNKRTGAAAGIYPGKFDGSATAFHYIVLNWILYWCTG